MFIIRAINRVKNWTDRSAQRRLLFLVIGFWILSVTVLSLTFFWIGQTQIINETRDRNIQLASIISRDINAQVSGIYSDLRVFSQHLETLNPDLASQGSAILEFRLASPQRYNAVYYFDSNQNLLLSIDDNVQNLLLIKNISDIISRPAKPLSSEINDAFMKVNGHNSYISDVYFTGIDRIPVLYAALPISLSDNSSKILVAEIDLRSIWQRIDLSTVGQTGYTYAVSRTGIIVADPNPADIGKPIPPELNSRLSGQEGFVRYAEPVTEQGMFAAYSPVGGTTGWGIVIVQAESEVNAPVVQAGIVIISVWIILAVVGTFSILWMVRSFTKPIIRLTKTTQEIASTGNLRKTALVQRSDEVGQLSQAFDHMVDRVQATQSELQNAHDKLETRVEERTTELQDANSLLQKEIAQREQVEAALRQSELKYRQLVQTANAIILEIDVEGKITFLNKFAEEFFGLSESSVLGKNIIDTFAPGADSSDQSLNVLVKNVIQHPEQYRHNENENIRWNGEKVWIAWTHQPIYDQEGQLQGILSIGADRTEEKRNEEMIAQQSKEKAAAEERNRLARDLHDAVSQTLFSASLIAEVLPRLWERNQDEARKRLEEIRQLSRGALAEMRTLLLELRPAALVDADMGELLKQLAASITGRARIPVSVEIEGECGQAPEVKVALYRIAQEALNNVAKHSGATQARVGLFCEADKIELIIGDNGKGFDISHTSPSSLGLGIMRERAKGIGAQVTIDSHPGQGTIVTVTWQEKSGTPDAEAGN